jgi:hypothetical protein
MMRRRDYILAVGATVGLAGCTGGNNRPGTTRSKATKINRSKTAEGTESDPKSVSKQTVGPATKVRQFYRALLAENTAILNRELVHPKSPTYPVTESNLPPKAFAQLAEVTVASVEKVSVQRRVVQRLGNPTKLLDWKRAMGVDDIQYVHTTFDVKKPDEEQAYVANTVDYTVKDDGNWYVRYDASKPTHSQ